MDGKGSGLSKEFLGALLSDLVVLPDNPPSPALSVGSIGRSQRLLSTFSAPHPSSLPTCKLHHGRRARAPNRLPDPLPYPNPSTPGLPQARRPPLPLPHRRRRAGRNRPSNLPLPPAMNRRPNCVEFKTSRGLGAKTLVTPPNFKPNFKNS